ncbi:sigma factor-like helix-turn-helix DNA-binding protein [Actinoplanes sp. M2I2]|uniref:sigma factor-like helix-turn-helix DNA-binding protein n=1 Tax=Actinoplanes sp. M2I2 TaxID=1734444 RepID=UPI00201FDEDC|nr:sigma factor-like helix-turn-helix DNA-binding protein [Actinoplanes sp. M2I2]
MSRRDQAAGEVLVRRLFAEHGAALLAYATRVSGDRVAAEGFVRGTLLRARADPAALSEDRGAVRAHLFGVLRAVAGLPSGSLEMLDAVGTLPPEEREVLNHLYFQGRDVKEAAASLGLPAETVKSRSYQAMRRLREAVAAGVSMGAGG